MKAIVCPNHDSPKVLNLQDATKASPKAIEVLSKIHNPVNATGTS